VRIRIIWSIRHLPIAVVMNNGAPLVISLPCTCSETRGPREELFSEGSFEQLANIQMEPTRPMSCAMMSSWRAAHLVR
jgi:hypothetical protein